MKKILSLMVVMCTALCAYASDLTFNVAVEGNTVTVTPSVEDQLYFCSAVDEATIEYFVEYMAELGMQLDPTSPDVLLTIATSLNKDNYFTGVTTLTVAEGNNVLVMCEAQEDGEGGYIPVKNEITIMPLTITSGGDDINVDLTFSFEYDNDGCTITPSDNDQEYVIYVAPKDLIDEELGMMNLTVETYMEMMARYGFFYGSVFQGVTYHTLEEFAEGDEIVDGLYLAIIAGVKDQGGYHDLTTPVYQFEWIVDHNTTGISNVEAAIMVSKIFMDGKFILGGHVGLDGKLIVK